MFLFAFSLDCSTKAARERWKFHTLINHPALTSDPVSGRPDLLRRSNEGLDIHMMRADQLVLEFFERGTQGSRVLPRELRSEPFLVGLRLSLGELNECLDPKALP